MTKANGILAPIRRHDREYFYKYVSADVAELILTNRTLRWSSPLFLNDPYDISPELPLNFTHAELVAAMNEEMASLIEKCTPPSSAMNMEIAIILQITNKGSAEKRLNMVRDLRTLPLEPTEGQIRAIETIKQAWRDDVPNMRVLCVSECNDLTSMWDRYADKYRGVVLQFEAVDEVDSSFLVAERVNYEDERPRIGRLDTWVRRMLGQTEVTYETLFKELQYRKTKDWASEREWRIVTYAKTGEGDLYSHYGFKARELVGVYFGVKCSDVHREKIKSLLAHNFKHARTYQAVLNPREGKFTFS